MEIRPARPDDLDALLAFPFDAAVGSLDPQRLREELEAGRLRWPWTWVAVDDDGALVGRALWWGRADSSAPLSLDGLDVLASVPDRTRLATDLLERAHRALAAAQPGPAGPPAYELTLPPRWRAAPAAVDAATWRVRAAAAAGLGHQLERLRYEWHPGAGVPGTTGRVRFRAGSEEEFLDVFEQAAVGTLDDTTLRALTEMGPAAQARDDHDFYLSCPGERDWWRIATAADGEPVGFVVPSATPYARNVGYLGVVPAHRGRGLVDDLLAEVTRVHAAEGAERITATTDTANSPMAAAFDRAGYRVTEVRLVLSAQAAAHSPG